MIKPEFEYLDKAFNNTYDCVEICTGYVNCDGVVSMNLSEIETILIQNAGQLCKRYASDVIYNIKALEECVKNSKDVDDSLFVFAIRENGVDDCGFLTLCLEQCEDVRRVCNCFYKKILAIKVTKENNGNVVCQLKEITSSLPVCYERRGEQKELIKSAS